MVEDTKKAKPRGPVYYIENMVRRQGTRLHRVKSPTRHRFKIFIAGQRLLRSKKMPLNEGQFRANEKKLVEMCLAGMVAIYTPTGLRVTTMHTGLFILTKPSGAVKILAQGELPTCFGGEGVALVQEAPKPVMEEVVTSASEEPEEEKVWEAEPIAEPDDLTALPNIGSGRARKLISMEVKSFAAVVELEVDGLVEALGIPEEMAEEIIEAAKE